MTLFYFILQARDHFHVTYVAKLSNTNITSQNIEGYTPERNHSSVRGVEKSSATPVLTASTEIIEINVVR